MENQQPKNKHEWSDDLRETLGVDPDELLATIDSYMKLYRKHVLLQFPLKDALMQSLKELFERQYPGIKPYHHGWHVNWVFEAISRPVKGQVVTKVACQLGFRGNGDMRQYHVDRLGKFFREY